MSRREPNAARKADDGAGLPQKRHYGPRFGQEPAPRIAPASRGERTEPAPLARMVRKEAVVDPNSPFAKLLVLKAQLEMKGKS